MAFAPGIQDRYRFGDYTALKPGQFATLVIQEHHAKRAGKHYDIRLGTPELGLFSWSSRKFLPDISDKILAIQQPLHDYDYKDYVGPIEAGYGAGDVRKVLETSVLVTNVTPDSISFTTAEERLPSRFTLVRDKRDPRRWYLINNTPSEYPDYTKPRMKYVDTEEVDKFIDQMKNGDTLQEKIDGAHGIIRLLKDTVEVYSVRKSVTGRPIVHTERIFGGRPKIQLPPEIRDSILGGEIWAEREGKAAAPQELGSFLNSAIAKSLIKQLQTGTKLKVSLFDIVRLGGKPVTDKDYQERLKLLQEKVLPYLPQDTFDIVQTATTPDAARKLWNSILKGENPRTEEGVILRPAGKEPLKAKLVTEFNVYIRGIFPGEGKYRNKAAGGFYYSFEPDGPIVGYVGTGFSDEFREELFRNPENYIGRVARVKAQGQFPSGALRAPVFIAVDEDKPQIAVPPATPPRGVKVAYLNIIDDPEHRGKWLNVFDEIKELVDKYKDKAVEAWKRGQLYIETEKGIIKIARTEWSPVGWVYDVMNWMTQPIGGPTPLSMSLAGGVLSGAIAAATALGIGTLLNLFEGKRKIVNTKKLVTRAAILGAILGALPGLSVGLSRRMSGRGWEGFTEPWPETPEKVVVSDEIEGMERDGTRGGSADSAVVSDETEGMERVAQELTIQYPPLTPVDQRTKEPVDIAPIYIVNEPHWRDVVLRDPYLTEIEKAVVATPVYATALAAGRNSVTPGEIAYTALKAGLGAIIGHKIGTLAGAILALSPEFREKLQQSGMLAGILKTVIT